MSGEPALSLPARLYLLSWDTRSGTLTGTATLGCLVRAAALTDLARRGLLVDRDGIVTPADPDASTGDAVLDGLLELVGESRPRGWQSWVGSRAKVTLGAVVGQLTERGLLREHTRRVLGVLPAHSHELAAPGVADGLRENARAVLYGDTPVEQVPERDAAVAALAASGGVGTVAPGKERRGHADRVRALGERGGGAAPELRKVIDEIGAAVAALAAGAAAGNATGS